MAETARSTAAVAKRGEKSAAAFRTISEVADELDVPQHVLRFWETKFAQVKPMKRGGGRRYYRPEDVELLRRIRELLYTEGYTIKGVQRLLRENGVKSLMRTGTSRVAPAPVTSVREVRAERPAPASGDGQGLDPGVRKELQALLDELIEIRALLRERS